MRVIGPTDAEKRCGAVAFVVDGVHPHDVGQILDDSGVEVRTGHHCAWPLHRALGVTASTRASFGPYTTLDEVDAFLTALDRVPGVLDWRLPDVDLYQGSSSNTPSDRSTPGCVSLCRRDPPRQHLLW